MTYGRVLCQVVETPAYSSLAHGPLNRASACRDYSARQDYSAGQDYLRGDYHDEWMTVEQDWPRDLLPWADPYIAVLMLRLERQYDWAGLADDSPIAADASMHSAEGAWQDLSWQDELFADDLAGNPWQDDAFRPGWHDGRRSNFPPVFGGFPLLDDVTDGLEEDPV
jgi:hypothetical protein